MAVSEATENYLETIYILSLRQNEVHAVDVCAYLSYSRPTVSIVLRQMRESGLVTVDEVIRIGVITHRDYRPTVLGETYLRILHRVVGDMQEMGEEKG